MHCFSQQPGLGAGGGGGGGFACVPLEHCADAASASLRPRPLQPPPRDRRNVAHSAPTSPLPEGAPSGGGSSSSSSSSGGVECTRGGHLYFGTLADAMSLHTSIPEPIAAVVSCLVERSAELEASLASESSTVRHHHYFFVDDAPEMEERAKFSHRNPAAIAALGFIDSHLRAGRNVYVHCEAGRTRSAALVALYLIVVRGCGYKEALGLLQSRRQVFVKALEPYLRHAASVAQREEGRRMLSVGLHLSGSGADDAAVGTPPSRSFTPIHIELHLPSAYAATGLCPITHGGGGSGGSRGGCGSLPRTPSRSQHRREEDEGSDSLTRQLPSPRRATAAAAAAPSSPCSKGVAMAPPRSVPPSATPSPALDGACNTQSSASCAWGGEGGVDT